MILSDKLKFIAIAAITVLVLMAALPAGVAAATIFEDDFESGAIAGAKWTCTACPKVADYTDYVDSGSYGLLFVGYTAGTDDHNLTSVDIDTTCMKDITLSYARKPISLEPNQVNNWFNISYSTDGGATWTLVEAVNGNYEDCSDPFGYTTNYALPPEAANNKQLRIKFEIHGNAQDQNASQPPSCGSIDCAALDNVIVTGEIDEKCAVPLLTPLGLVVLVGVLSIVAISTVLARKKR